MNKTSQNFSSIQQQPLNSMDQPSFSSETKDLVRSPKLDQTNNNVSSPRKTGANFSSDANESDRKNHQLLQNKELSGRERLEMHREEVAGRITVPEKWSQESLLKEWMDCSSFDKVLAPTGVDSAREALIAEGRRAKSQRLVGSSC